MWVAGESRVMQLCPPHLLPRESNRMDTRTDGSVCTSHMGLEVHRVQRRGHGLTSHSTCICNEHVLLLIVTLFWARLVIRSSQLL